MPGPLTQDGYVFIPSDASTVPSKRLRDGGFSKLDHKPFERALIINMRTTLRISFFWVAIVSVICIQCGSPFASEVNEMGGSVVDTKRTDIIVLLIYVFLALGFSFLCSIAEAVLLSITPSYIEGLKEKKPKRASLLKRLKMDDVDRSLAAILTLNTIAHTVGAIGAGAKATVVFGSALFGIFSVVMTLMILFLSEIVPKTIGAVYWPSLVGPVSIFVRALIVVLYPIVWFSEKMTKIISHGKDLHLFTRDEFVAMASVGEKTGEIDDKESRIIRNLLRFESLQVADIMTPRTVITTLNEDLRVADSLTQVAQSPFSRIPVHKMNVDDITGFVLKADVLITNFQEGGESRLKTLKREIIPVPESVSLTVLLERFLKERKHIAIVTNEHGGTEGLVTLEDLIETLMGIEIMDETDNVEDMRVLARKQWMERAKAMGITLAE